jgi:hypothetical protein
VGRGFRDTPALACRFGEQWGAGARFLNATAVECLPPAVLTAAPGDPVPLAVTLNGLDIIATIEGGARPLQVVAVGIPAPTALTPATVFVGEVDVQLDVWAAGLWQSEWLSCRLDGVLVLAGTLIEDPSTGAQAVRCHLPSTQYLRAATGAPAGQAAAVTVEVSNDGQLYSAVGLQLLLTSGEQLRGISPTTGPPSGGTVIEIHLADLAPANSVVPRVTCEFPGPVVVEAEYVASDLVRCTAPPLAELGPERLWERSWAGGRPALWSWAPVTLWLQARTLGSFLFAYTRGVAVLRVQPPDAVPPPAAGLGGYTVEVHGTAFLPARQGGVRCRVELGPQSFVELDADYIRNGTLRCTIPGADLAESWAARPPGAESLLLVIEVSLNGGQQYTSDGQGLVLRAADRLLDPGSDGEPPLTPAFTYPEGGALLTVRYAHAYSPASPRARYVFRYPACASLEQCDGTAGVDLATEPLETGEASSPIRQVRMPLLAVDEAAGTVSCFAPPAHLLDAALAASGGLVSLQLSSNGRDPSSNSWPLSYRRAPLVREIVPQWLLAEANQSVSIVGKHFFPDFPVVGSAFTLTSRSDPSRVRMVPVVFVDEEHLELAWPAGAFLAGEQVSLALSLDGGRLLSPAPGPIVVYGGVTLARVRPLRLYAWQPGEPAQLLYAETLTDLADTEGLGRLLCRFGKAAQVEQPVDARLTGNCTGCDPATCCCTAATYINATLLSCPLPNLATLGPVEVAVTVDGGASYSVPASGLPVRVQVMARPGEQGQNVTQRYETADLAARHPRAHPPRWLHAPRKGLWRLPCLRDSRAARRSPAWRLLCRHLGGRRRAVLGTWRGPGARVLCGPLPARLELLLG